MGVDAWFRAFLVFLAIERGFEMGLARRNEAWIRSQGGREYGAVFTRVIFVFHLAWFLSFAVEAFYRKASLAIHPALFIILVLLLQGARYTCIASLGKFWNTKILVLPGASPVRRGPYRFLKHPNYLVVILELVLYPACFRCVYTAVIFGILNLALLWTRIREEERALAGLQETSETVH